MTWLAGYQRVDLGKTGGPYDRRDHPKLCWHTTEGATLAGAETAFYPYPPHLGVDAVTGECHQYIDLDRCAYSLGNSDAENSYVIQVEVVGYAGLSHDWPLSVLEWLADHVVTPVETAVGVPAVIAPQGFHGEGEGIILASSSSPIRMSLAEWDGFAGHVGHQHCPGDDHWDPGRLDVAAILAATTGEDDMPLNDADKAWIVQAVQDARYPLGVGSWRHATQLDFAYVDGDGDLCHVWYIPGEPWHHQVLADGCVPSGAVAVDDGYEGKLHLLAPAATGGAVHVYWTGRDWATEHVARP